MTTPATLKTFLWFNEGLHDALKFYKATFGDEMKVDGEILFTENLFVAEFSIYGHKLMGMKAPGGDAFNNSISLMIQVDGQDESDRLWELITANGAPGRCGWCTDKWGVNWQVTPFQMSELLANPDPSKAEQNWGILRNMTKIQLSDFIK